MPTLTALPPPHISKEKMFIHGKAKPTDQGGISFPSAAARSIAGRTPRDSQV